MKNANDIDLMTVDEKNQLQLERLQSTINRAFRHVNFHRKRFAEAGTEPSKIQSIQDIARLPFMRRKHLSEHYPYDLFAVPLRDIVRIHTAPGTTHNPTVSGYTLQDLHTWQEILARGLKAAGVTPHDILQITLTPGLANWGRDYKSGAEAIEASVIPNIPLSIEKKVMVLRDYKTSVLVTTPALAMELAAYIQQQHINTNAFELTTLILAGDLISPEHRRFIEETLHAETWLHYGLSEVPGPAIAFECEVHDGLHVNEDHFLAEIVDPDTGAPLPEGETGELVLTTLTTRAFPLIRFRTGDKASFYQTACACGRSLKRINWHPGRTDEIMNIDGVNVHGQLVLANLEKTIGPMPAAVRFFVQQAEEKKYLEIWMPVSAEIFSDEIKELEKLIHRAENKLRENLGVPVHIRLKEKAE
ncbi:MAG: AMP-binding protein [Desulfobacterales bacterium]|nr:AMP-binding protein [Desulfobacterales bacterium]